MSSRNPEIEAVLRELAAVVLEAPPRVSNGGAHVKIAWRVSGKPPRIITVSATPSDWRGPANARALARRLLRADDAMPKLPPPRRRRAPQPKPIGPRPIVVPAPPIKPKPPLPPIRTIASERLSPAATEIWAHLFYDQPVKLSALAAALQKKVSTLAVALNGLKRRGIVKNLPDRGGWLKAPLP